MRVLAFVLTFSFTFPFSSLHFFIFLSFFISFHSSFFFTFLWLGLAAAAGFVHRGVPQLSSMKPASYVTTRPFAPGLAWPLTSSRVAALASLPTL